MKNIFTHLGIAALISAIVTFSCTSLSPILKANQLWVWSSLVFLILVFSLVNYILFNGINAKSQQAFMTFFALSFGLKVFGTLAWLIIILFIVELKDFAYIELFFAQYFILTFLLMAEVWQRTKRK